MEIKNSVASQSLTGREKTLFEKQVRRKTAALAFSIVSLLAAAALTLVWMAQKQFTGPKVVLIILILINSKNNLRIYRLSSILEKLGK